MIDGVMVKIDFNYYFTMIFGAIILILMTISIIARRMKSEPWDEMAARNYAKARRITMNFLEIVMLICGVFFLLFHVNIVIGFELPLFALGCIYFIQTSAFVFIDRKEA